MSSIEQLGERVAVAERRFGLIYEQQTRFSERLLGLIDAIEVRLRDQQTEIDQQADEIERLGAEAARHAAEAERLSEEIERKVVVAAQKGDENEQLRTMLLSLLRAIERGSRDVLAETMQTLDAKVVALIAAPATTGAAPEPEAAHDLAADGAGEPAAEVEVDAMVEPAPEEAVPPAAEEIAEDAPEAPEAEPAPEDPAAEGAGPDLADAGMPELGSEAAETPIADDQGVAAPPAEPVEPGTATLTDIMDRVARLVEQTGGEIARPEADVSELEAEPGPGAAEAPDDEPEGRSIAGA